MKSETFREAQRTVFFNEKPALFRFLGRVLAVGAWIWFGVVVSAALLLPIYVAAHYVIKFW